MRGEGGGPVFLLCGERHDMRREGEEGKVITSIFDE